MASTLNMTKQQKGGAYADILDFLGAHSARYGSTTNAAAALLRGTGEYRSWQANRKRRPKRKVG